MRSVFQVFRNPVRWFPSENTCSIISMTDIYNGMSPGFIFNNLLVSSILFLELIKKSALDIPFPKRNFSNDSCVTMIFSFF